jgi:hypothetical protein
MPCDTTERGLESLIDKVADSLFDDALKKASLPSWQ